MGSKADRKHLTDHQPHDDERILHENMLCLWIAGEYEKRRAVVVACNRYNDTTLEKYSKIFCGTREAGIKMRKGSPVAEGKHQSNLKQINYADMQRLLHELKGSTVSDKRQPVGETQG